MRDTIIQPESSAEKMSLEDLTAVVVDDSEGCVSFIEEVTRMVGLSVRSFLCPLTALDYVRANPVDMICIDFNMPEMDGLTFVGEARKVHHDVPAVLVTAEANAEELKELSRRKVISGFFVKPFSAMSFFDKVKPIALLRQYTKFVDAYRQKDEFGNHRIRVGCYAKIIAGALNWDDNDRDMIYYGAQAHDIGMISIPDSILFKPSRPTRDNIGLIRKHTIIGHSMLRGCQNPYFKMASAICLTHHERFDGSGYPFGLLGDAIPAAGRIAGLADVFDVLTSERPYKTAWNFDKAFRYIGANGNMNFDPEVVNAFVENADRIKDVYTKFAD